MVSMETTIGGRIAEARKAKGFNQSELATRIGVTPQSVQHWENDRTVPRNNRVELLASVMGVSQEWILFGDKPDRVGDSAEVVYTYKPSPGIVHIPFFCIETAAEKGEDVSLEDVTDRVSFGKEILEKHGLEQGQVVAVVVSDDHMEPRILKGDTVLVDKSDKTLVDNHVYLIRVENALRVQRMVSRVDGKWVITCDNAKFAQYDTLISREEFDQLNVIGRVFMILMGEI